MASLPPTLDFSKMEESICDKWEKEESFKTQDKLSMERGDEVGKKISFREKLYDTVFV